MSGRSTHTVLVPGLLCSARLYEDLLPVAWSHGAATIADTRRDDTLAAMAERLLADAPERFALVGLSMGGYLALELMRRAPGRVLALALISTSAHPDTPEQTAVRREQNEIARSGGFEQLIDEVFPALVDPSVSADPDLLGVWREMARAVGAGAFCSQQRAIIARGDSRPLLGAISCPTAVIHGDGDQLIAVEQAEETAGAIPGAQLTVIGRCGHMSALERGPEVGAALERLLQTVS